MPVIGRAAGTVTLPARTARLVDGVDVLIVGGGAAGLGAAIGAADAGARVVLAERHGFLGGTATASLMVTLSSYHTWSQEGGGAGGASVLFPADHGPGKPVIAGVLSKLVGRLVRRGGGIPPSRRTGYVTPFDPEVFKLVSLGMLEEAGVSILLHAFASGVISDAGRWGVVFETKSGPLVIRADAVVDCTGDGDVAAYAGAPYEVGREGNGLAEPISLLFLMGGFRQSRFENYVRSHPGEWSGVHGLWSLIAKASSEGRLSLPREDILMFGTTREGWVSVNSTRIVRRYGADVLDLTAAEVEGRRQMAQIVSFLRDYVPGFEGAYLCQSGSEVGVRETRRVVGRYKLTAEDILHARKFDDVIARGTYPIDIHSPEGKGTTLIRVPPGEAYDIPLRCLLPAGVDGLVVAGRCISGTHEAQASYRAMPICVATGQAAGVCAAIASRGRISTQEVAAPAVQDELLRQGADLRNIRGR